jgi:predicted phage terminase large subunit-like protein
MDQAEISVNPIESLKGLRGLSLNQAIRLTPATLAYHITDGRWIPARHLLYIAQVIAREVAIGGARIIVEAPPRHGKSELLSVHTPTWFLDKYPDQFVMLTSYNADLPVGFARRVRDTIAEFGGIERGPTRLGANEPDDLPAFRRPVLNVRLRADSRQVSQWNTSVGGGMYAVGIGGPLTGRGANLLLIDDFCKNAQEAESPASQEHNWDWLISTAYTRLEPNGSLIGLATRWNINDLIGKLKRHIRDLQGRWIVITLPANAEANDVLGRVPGEALWPERYNEEALKERKAILGRYYYSALYQQKPIRKEDAHASPDDLTFVDILPALHHTLAVRSWDFAGSKGKGDYTVGSLIGAKGNPGTSQARYGIYDLVRGQWGPKKVEEVLRETAENDGAAVTIVIEQEPGSSGKAYAEYLRDKVLVGFKTVIVSANEAKWIKAQPFLAAVENHQVDIKKAGWNDPLKDELEDFPDGAYDDIIDSISIGINYLVTQQHRSVVWGRPRSEADVTESAPLRGAVFGRH